MFHVYFTISRYTDQLLATTILSHSSSGIVLHTLVKASWLCPLPSSNHLVSLKILVLKREASLYLEHTGIRIPSRRFFTIHHPIPELSSPFHAAQS